MDKIESLDEMFKNKNKEEAKEKEKEQILNTSVPKILKKCFLNLIPKWLLLQNIKMFQIQKKKKI